MTSSKTRSRRLGAALAAAAAVAALLAALATPAGAVSGEGSAHFRLADHDRGRTLSGQGVEIVAGGGARDGRWLTLPIGDVEPDGDNPAARSGGWLRFERGKRRVAFTDLRFDLVAGQIAGKLGGEEMSVFWTGAPSRVDRASGKVAVQGGALRLIRRPATLLKRRLRLRRPLVGKGVGMVWMAARANPTRVSTAIDGGAVEWGVLASWRFYVLTHLGPPSPPAPSNAGEITLGGGATASSPLAAPESFVSFPASGGTFERGLYGASDRLTVKSKASVTFRKPGHCIVEVRMADVEATIDGAESSLTLDARYDIDLPPSCEDQPPVATDGVEFAALDIDGIAPTYSDDGKTVTWEAIPAVLTEAGAAAFGAGYEAGTELDPVTVRAEVG